MSTTPEREEALTREACVLGRYLIDREPRPEECARYAAGCRTLFADEDGTPLVAFCRRHPRALPFLDAAAGLVAPRASLRRRLVLMTAVLEASPAHVDRFDETIASAPLFVLRGGALALLAAAKAAVGLALWPFVGAGRGERA